MGWEGNFFVFARIGSVRLSICSSVHPSVSLGVFLEWYYYFFLNFLNGNRNPYKVVRDRAEISGKIFFALK